MIEDSETGLPYGAKEKGFASGATEAALGTVLFAPVGIGLSVATFGAADGPMLVYGINQTMEDLVAGYYGDSEAAGRGFVGLLTLGIAGASKFRGGRKCLGTGGTSGPEALPHGLTRVTNAQMGKILKGFNWKFINSSRVSDFTTEAVSRMISIPRRAPRLLAAILEERGHSDGLKKGRFHWLEVDGSWKQFGEECRVKFPQISDPKAHGLNRVDATFQMNNLRDYYHSLILGTKPPPGTGFFY